MSPGDVINACKDQQFCSTWGEIPDYSLSKFHRVRLFAGISIYTTGI